MWFCGTRKWSYEKRTEPRETKTTLEKSTQTDEIKLRHSQTSPAVHRFIPLASTVVASDSLMKLPPSMKVFDRRKSSSSSVESVQGVMMGPKVKTLMKDVIFANSMSEKHQM